MAEGDRRMRDTLSVNMRVGVYGEGYSDFDRGDDATASKLRDGSIYAFS